MITALLSVALLGVTCWALDRHHAAALFEHYYRKEQRNVDYWYALAQKAEYWEKRYDAGCRVYDSLRAQFIRAGQNWINKYERVRAVLDPRGVCPEPPPGVQYKGPDPLRGISLVDLASRVRAAADRHLMEDTKLDD